ncbi:AP2 domain-containing protein [Ruegeria sp. EL01]|uniref:AP2 domain-containing protein n=1 Tax=Ruegeria sp. EL01 TaxID=2107578 RepID=UPI000EA81C4D
MHRVLMGEPFQGVDHRDGDGLNNRRSNLRTADKSQNARNTGAHADNLSGLKGVSYSRQRRNWRAAICVRGKRKHLGVFDSPEEAHAAYVQAAHQLHGQFARSE